MCVQFTLTLIAILLACQTECCDISSGVSLTEAGLPTVDLREPAASSMLATALQEWGFSYITGHGVPENVIEKANEQSKKFFDLPERVKRQVQANRKTFLKTSRGYTGRGQEQLDVSASGKPDIKEVFDIGHISNVRQQTVPHVNPYRQILRNPTSHTRHSGTKIAQTYLGKNKYPQRGKREANGELQNAIETYSEDVSMVAQNVLSVTAKGLGCEDDLKPVFGPDALQIQRLTRYPPMHEIDVREPGQIGAGVHSDYGGITVLYAEGPGLAVLKPNKTSNNVDIGTFSPELEVPNSGQWVEVDSIRGAFIVMAGEALQRLSNGQIYAAKHKVDFTGSVPRYSLAFFYDPNPEAVLEPLECFKRNGKPLYKAKVAGHKGVIRTLFRKDSSKISK